MILAHGFSYFKVKQEKEQTLIGWNTETEIFLPNLYFQLLSFQVSQLGQRSATFCLLSEAGREWDKGFGFMGRDGLFEN